MKKIWSLGAGPLLVVLLVLGFSPAAWADCPTTTTVPANPVIATGGSSATTLAPVEAGTTTPTATSGATPQVRAVTEPLAPFVEAASGPSGPLAFTGLDVTREAGLGTGMGLTGLVLAVAVRRRRGRPGGHRGWRRVGLVATALVVAGGLVLLVTATAGWAAPTGSPAGTGGTPAVSAAAVTATSPGVSVGAECGDTTTTTVVQPGQTVGPVAALPESPLEVGLPVAAAALLGAVAWTRRRRRP